LKDNEEQKEKYMKVTEDQRKMKQAARDHEDRREKEH
jgi:hypothetical protein